MVGVGWAAVELAVGHAIPADQWASIASPAPATLGDRKHDKKKYGYGKQFNFIYLTKRIDVLIPG